MRCNRQHYVDLLRARPALCLAEVHKKRADVLDLTGVYDKATGAYLKAKDLFNRAGCKSQCGEVDHALGNLLINMGAFEQAEESFTKALGIFTVCRDDRNIAKCYKELGKVCQYRENPDGALAYYQKAIGLYDKLEDIEGHNIIMQYLADVYRTKGEYNKALEITDHLQKYYCESTEYGSLCRINKLAGYVYQGKGDNELSKKYLEKAYQYTIKTGESSMAMYILCDLGAAYYYTKEYKTAYEHFDHCLSLAEKLDSSYMRAINLVNLSDACLKMGNIRLSKEYINKATTINHNIGGLNSEIQRIQKEIAQKEGGQEESNQA